MDNIDQTFSHTTQYARQIHHDGYMKKHFMSRFPELNVARCHEAVATDTVFSDTPAIDDGSKCAQLFVVDTTLFADVYGMKSTSQFVHTLQDVIHKRGAMDKLLSDRLKLKFLTKALTSSVPTELMIGPVNLIISIKTMLSAGTKPSNTMSIKSWIALVPLNLPGYYVFDMFVIY